jgi:hypothetical protein
MTPCLILSVEGTNRVDPTPGSVALRLAHEALTRGAHERNRVGEEHEHRVTERALLKCPRDVHLVDIGFAWPVVGVQEVDRVVASIAGVLDRLRLRVMLGGGFAGSTSALPAPPRAPPMPFGEQGTRSATTVEVRWK